MCALLVFCISETLWWWSSSRFVSREVLLVRECDDEYLAEGKAFERFWNVFNQRGY